MFWYGVAMGSAATFAFMFIVLALTKSTKDQAWMETEMQFRRDLIEQWNQSNLDNAERNRALWALREGK